MLGSYNKTLKAIADFNGCIGWIETPRLDQKRYDFLINTFEILINKKSKADCSSLIRFMPRQFMSYNPTLRFLSPNRSSNIQPIKWLQCRTETRRVQDFKYDSDEIGPVNNSFIYGVDYASDTIFSERKNARLCNLMSGNCRECVIHRSLPI